MESNGDNMSMKNGDIIRLKYVYKNDKLKIWESIFISEISYLDFIYTRDVIILTSERTPNIYGKIAERMNARKSKKEVI